jgi:hypothetical protein
MPAPSRLFNLNRTRLNLWLDIALTIAFAIELEYHFTGLRIHELLGVAFGVAMLIHLVLHLDWVWSLTKAFFRLLLHESRLNYVLNLLLFIDALILVLSGLFISRTLGLTFNVGRWIGLSWERIHILSADVSLVLIAMHVAMHWKWLGTHLKRTFSRGNEARKGSRTKGGWTIGAIVFCVVVLQMGLLFSTSRYMRNPFLVFAELSHLSLSRIHWEASRSSQPVIQLAPSGVTIIDGGLAELRWRDFGRVLFDWWVIAAFTALILIMGPSIGRGIKWLRSLRAAE